MFQMARKAKRLNLDDRGKIILGDMGNSQRVFPTQVEFAGTPAQLVTLRTAPAARFFNRACDDGPVRWIVFAVIGRHDSVSFFEDVAFLQRIK